MRKSLFALAAVAFTLFVDLTGAVKVKHASAAGAPIARAQRRFAQIANKSLQEGQQEFHEGQSHDPCELPPLTAEQKEQIWKEAIGKIDANGDGQLQFEEFIAVVGVTQE